jgi:predicted nucleic acid-binding protein
MTLLVDTSVWSLALRRDEEIDSPEVTALRAALAGAQSVVVTGLVLQELLQGFAALPLIQPDREDHIAAAQIRNLCRRNGIQIGTIDALLIQLYGRYDLTLLTTDQDFQHASKHVPFKRWSNA